MTMGSWFLLVVACFGVVFGIALLMFLFGSCLFAGFVFETPGHEVGSWLPLVVGCFAKNETARERKNERKMVCEKRKLSIKEELRRNTENYVFSRVSTHQRSTLIGDHV